VSDESAQTLPALSVWQPYATLIDVKAKHLETRHWPAPAASADAPSLWLTTFEAWLRGWSVVSVGGAGR
jgi:hypothetical protein